MKEFIQKLPIEIVLQIISYTYQPQNKDLLYDITNYTKTKIILFDLYYHFWIINMQQQSNEDKNWLFNDLIAYMNDYNATMYGYVDKFYTIFKRNPFLQTNEDVRKYMVNLEKKDISSQINSLFGLLLPDERHDIIISFIETNETLLE